MMAKTAYLEVPVQTSCAVCSVGYVRTLTVKIRMTWLGRIYWGAIVKVDQEGHSCRVELEHAGA